MCYLCHGEVDFDDATRDHVHPRSRGGPDGCKNLRLAHGDCNRAKGAMMLDELRRKTA